MPLQGNPDLSRSAHLSIRGVLVILTALDTLRAGMSGSGPSRHFAALRNLVVIGHSGLWPGYGFTA
jgi:hypothetical protein